LLDQDQENPGIYVLDVVKNGHWICQRDLLGDIASKPPLYTWIASLVSLVLGRVSLFSLYLPGALALFGSACLIFIFGRKTFGKRAALFGALAVMLCPAGLKQFGLARTDGVFAFTVTLSAFCAYRAWLRGGGWTWFWLGAAAATLTKGPLGLVLAAFGLLASVWEARSGARLPMKGSQVPGVILFIVLTFGWLGAAVWALGQPVIDKLFLREFVFHIVEGEQKKPPGSMVYLSPLYYLAHAVPWSVLSYVGIWRIARRPADGVDERRLERFLFCWFMGGLVLFSLAPHQRGDLLWPLLPAGALIAGRELDRRFQQVHPAKVSRGALIVTVLGVACFAIEFFGFHVRRPRVLQTVALQRLAAEFERRGGSAAELLHTDDPAGLQVFLNTYRQPITFERAAERLREPGRVCIAVSNWPALQALRQPTDPPVFTLLEDDGPLPFLHVRIVSNRPDLNPSIEAPSNGRASQPAR
jgi:4-amino-4-deoxy-L-arabinose transferase-like glycosyltransferase